jgi:hypothetical protein
MRFSNDLKQIRFLGHGSDTSMKMKKIPRIYLSEWLDRARYVSHLAAIYAPQLNGTYWNMGPGCWYQYRECSQTSGGFRNEPVSHCQAWTTSYQLTPFIALLDLRAPWGWQQREKNESGRVECRRINKIKSSEYMSEYPTIYT